MSKTILITGATDGIGLETAKLLASEGHHVLLHGRNETKLAAAVEAVGGNTDAFIADLSTMAGVEKLAAAVIAKIDHLDVLLNNAGVYKTSNPITQDGMDVRFVVNTLAPYLLSQRLMPLMNGDSRIVNLSSAAQAPVNLSALAGNTRVDDMEAYAQSKLAITMWTSGMAKQFPDGPVFIAVNPGSLLASKMVKEGFGVEGKDLQIGVQILKQASLGDEFANATGEYFDNDIGQFSTPHPAGLDPAKIAALMRTVEQTIAQLASS